MEKLLNQISIQTSRGRVFKKPCRSFFKSLALACLLILTPLLVLSCGGSSSGGSPTYYSVIFDTDGGSEIPSQTVEAGGKAAEPAQAPVKADCSFKGWYTDKTFNTRFNFEKEITRPVTIYACWQPDLGFYLVSFVTNIDVNIQSQTIQEGKKAAAPQETLEREKYKFAGWYTDQTFNSPFDFESPVASDLTLYASWTKAEDPAPTPLPDPLVGGESALDPVPELKPGVTTDLYLVKGQKFNIGQGWYIDKNDKDSKKKVSINKKGLFKAKANGDAVIKYGAGDTTYSVNLHISTPKMSKKSLTYETETATDFKTEQIPLVYDSVHLDVYWYSANPDVVTVDNSGNVTIVGKGSSVVTAYINGSAYKCKVTVKEKVALQNHTIHLAKGTSKSISIKGLKKPEWKMSEEGIVEVKKNKVSGIKAGTVDLSFTQGDITYTVTVIVEDLTMSGTGLKPGKTNKYTIDELKIGDTTKLSFAGVEQDTVFKSSKPDIAFIDEELNVVIRGKGKAKFTAKVNGKPVTISVNVK